LGEIYSFLKKDQRLYWLHGELPLLETSGNQALSAPIASVIILEATHYLDNGIVWTKGKYKIIKIFKDQKVHFNGFTRIYEKEYLYFQFCIFHLFSYNTHL